MAAADAPSVEKPFEPADLAAVYLGAAMPEEQKQVIIELVKKKYRRAKIFDGRLSVADYSLEFDELSDEED